MFFTMAVAVLRIVRDQSPAWRRNFNGMVGSMILTQLEYGQGIFTSNYEKTLVYNDIFDTINAADADLRPKMSALFDELRRVNREFAKMIDEQDRHDFSK